MDIELNKEQLMNYMVGSSAAAKYAETIEKQGYTATLTIDQKTFIEAFAELSDKRINSILESRNWFTNWYAKDLLNMDALETLCKNSAKMLAFIKGQEPRPSGLPSEVMQMFSRYARDSGYEDLASSLSESAKKADKIEDTLGDYALKYGEKAGDDASFWKSSLYGHVGIYKAFKSLKI